MMNTALLLTALKADLGITTDAYNERLTSRLLTAQARIAEEGATLSDTPADRDLVVMYAAWLWRFRQTSEPMPRMLRWALNNKIFAQKAAAT